MDTLIKHIESTKKSRFNASRRMFRSHIASLVCISFSSLFIICINIFELLPSIESPTLDGIYVPNELVRYRSVASVASIIMSTIVLVLSVIVFGLNYNIKSENFHSCGVELAELEDIVRLSRYKPGDPSEGEERNKIAQKYHNILKRHNLNHRVIDYLYAKANDEKLNTSLSEKEKIYSVFANWRIRCWWHLSNDSTMYWIFLLLEFAAVATLLYWRIQLIL